MKYRALVLSILLSAPLFGHKEYRMDIDKILADSSAVVISEVKEVKVDESRCTTSTYYTLKTKSVVFGTIDEKVLLVFDYSVHFPRQAKWPWQKDCPSVHYYLPPIADNMKKGTEVIATVKLHENSGRYIVLSTHSIGELADIRERLKSLK